MDFYISISTISGNQNVKVDHHAFVPEGTDPSPVLTAAVTEAAGLVIAEAEAAYQRTQPAIAVLEVPTEPVDSPVEFTTQPVDDAPAA